MNNSYYLYADSSKGKYNPFSNLLFYCKEVWRFDKFFLVSMFLAPFPELLGNYLGTLLPAILLQCLEDKSELRTLFMRVGLVGAGFILCSVLRYVLTVYYSEIRRFFDNYLGERFINKLKDVDYELIENKDFQECYTNAWNSANNGRGFWEGATFIPDLLVCVFAIGLYGWILGSRNLLVLVLVFVCVGVNLYLLSVARKMHRKYFGRISKYAKGEAYITEITMDSASGKDIRIYNMLDFILKKYDENLKHIGLFYGKIHNWYCFRNVCGAVLGFLRDAAAYLFLIRELTAGNISAAEFVFLLGVIDNLAQYFEWLLRKLMGWNTLDASVGYFRQYLDAKSSYRQDSVIPKEQLEKIKEQGIELELRNISYTYSEAAEPTIKNFSLKVKSGEKLALIGLNGAGKTTLVKLICGFYTPDEGKILINGIEREQFTKEEYTSLLSVMFQDASFLPLTVDENLTSEKAPDREKLEQALKLSGFYERYDSLPKRGQSMLIKKLEETAVDFSGGEKQKLVFARAIYRNAPMVILDEPTAALDPIAENELYCNFKEAIGNKTAIYISHRLSSTRFCDRIVLIEHGRIMEEGTHDSLLNQGGRYAKLYEMQSRYYKEEDERRTKRRLMGDEPEVSEEGGVLYE